MTIRNLAMIATVVAALFGLHDHTSAQDLEPGMRVRLYPVAGATDKPYIGTIEAVDSTRVVLIRGSSTERIELPISVITQYEVSLGDLSQGRSVWDGIQKGAIIGLSLGLGGGVVYAYAQGAQAGVKPEYGKHMRRGVLYAGSVSVLIGALMGQRVTERWSAPIPLH